MRERLAKWAVTLGIFFGVPIAFVWIFMPYLDLSHATYLAGQGDYVPALRTLNRALRFNGGLASAYVRRGWVYEKLGDTDRAMADFNHAISISDSDWEAFNNRAWLAANMTNGDLHKAMDDANQAISLCGDCAPPYDTRGFIEMKMEQADKAVEDFTHAINLNAKLGEVYYHRSLAYEKLNDPDKARLDRMRAHEYGFYEQRENTGSTAGSTSPTAALK